MLKTEKSVLLAQKGKKTTTTTKLGDKIVKKKFLITNSILIFICFR